MSKEIQVITPVTVTTHEELRDAMGEKKCAIIISGKALFNDIEEHLGKAQAAKTAKRIGNVATAGAIILAPAVGIAAVAGANIIAHLADKFRKYTIWVDYTSHQMVMLDNYYTKKKHPCSIGEKADKIIKNSTKCIG